MSVTNENVIGEHVVRGRRVEVVQITWRGKPGVSYDLRDADTGQCLTEEQSFGDYPSEDQMANAVEEAEEHGDGCICTPCFRRVNGYNPPAAGPVSPEAEQDFDVSWETTVTAASPEQAARKAATLLGQVDPHRQVFDVRPYPDDGQNWERIDLAGPARRPLNRRPITREQFDASHSAVFQVLRDGKVAMWRAREALLVAAALGSAATGLWIVRYDRYRGYTAEAGCDAPNCGQPAATMVGRYRACAGCARAIRAATPARRLP